MSKLYINKRYGIAPNDLLNNPELSLKAKGLFTFLQSKPDGWKFSIERIAMQTKDGKDSVRSAIAELEEHGYLIRKPVRKETGEWDGYDYILSETPADLPTAENPTAVEPTTENTDTLSKKDKSKKDIVKKIEKVFNHWNSKNIIKHKKITKKMEQKLNALLKDYSLDEILQAIDNYAEILHSPDTYWTYKWTLEEFLGRENGARQFVYKSVNDYLKKDQKQKPKVLQDLSGY